ncbi:uncharacterized protein LOC112637511 [Camponotus floridanus]|uniref:uncharacterized protein LOC112637511 n=1 Tax=Camponotus floridanus TaxID=104421 RepID=UPI000DC66D64|nr:uncharacterized protein LOC112637511 [Camponotus floridanus]
MHAFCDASERAYAAAVYLRGIKDSGEFGSSLLIAKTKVAPLRPVSIPRLELCGALLAARLLRRIATELQIASAHLYAWTDARVVLAWIRAHPSRWTAFVANRVAAIQEWLPPVHWRYVSTQENPADLATRGIAPSDLESSQLWWTGPQWLKSPSESWYAVDSVESEVDEERRSLATPFALDSCEMELAPEHFLSLPMNRCRLRWLRIVQQQSFAAEHKTLSEGEPVSRRSALLALRPFIAGDGLIRVGGRLGHAPLTFEEKHPIILAKDNHLSLLLVRDAHHRTLHGGPQLTRSVLIRRYWILRVNSLIKSVTRNCVRCVRFKNAPAQQQMGHLPGDRVRAARPFWSSGVDYAGPIQLRASKGRGQKSYKGYICIFVCMSTRAVHLEAVSDLSSDSFLAAFARFVARRGRCARLASDNGTNFRGPDKVLRDMFQAASDFYHECRDKLAQDSTEWHFIPPSAPHFGGLLEAGVKAIKYHLQRVLGDQLLTYEELSTLLCEIEACLNSRPLYPLSNDPADYAAITPGHFLIGETPINIPEPPSPVKTSSSATSRYKLISNMRDHFWHRWSQEYLQHLQQLGRWRHRFANLQPGALVLIKDDLRPPAKWSLGRVVQVHPGDDGLVRVVTVNTPTSQLRRPISKICPLPINHEEANHATN